MDKYILLTAPLKWNWFIRRDDSRSIKVHKDQNIPVAVQHYKRLGTLVKFRKEFASSHAPQDVFDIIVNFCSVKKYFRRIFMELCYLSLHLESVSSWLTDSETWNKTRIVLLELFRGQQGMCVSNSHRHTVATIATISTLAHRPNYIITINTVRTLLVRGNEKTWGA